MNSNRVLERNSKASLEMKRERPRGFDNYVEDEDEDDDEQGEG